MKRMEVHLHSSQMSPSCLIGGPNECEKKESEGDNVTVI